MFVKKVLLILILLLPVAFSLIIGNTEVLENSEIKVSVYPYKT